MGSHCQFVKDETPSRDFDASKKSLFAEESSTDSAFGIGAYVIFSIMGVGLISTIVILVYQKKKRNSVQGGSHIGEITPEKEEPSIAALEAGVVTKSSRTGIPEPLDNEPSVPQIEEEEKEEIAAISQTGYEVSGTNDQELIPKIQSEDTERPAGSIQQTNQEGVTTAADVTEANATANTSATEDVELGSVDVFSHQAILFEAEESAHLLYPGPDDVLEGNAGLDANPSSESNEVKPSSLVNPLPYEEVADEIETIALENSSIDANPDVSSKETLTSQEGNTGKSDDHDNELVPVNYDINVDIDNEIVNPGESTGPDDSEQDEKKSDRKTL